MSSPTAKPVLPETAVRPDLAALRDFVEHEADLLDQQRFTDWVDLFDEDGSYWVPAQRDQVDTLCHVSLFYDDKTILRTRAARLGHHMIHCQDPPSNCVRLVSGFRLDQEAAEAGSGLHVVTSKFVMLEDRPNTPRRLFGGRYRHVIRQTEHGFRLVSKRVDLTNCDQSFPALTQPF